MTPPANISRNGTSFRGHVSFKERISYFYHKRLLQKSDKMPLLSW